MYISKQGTYALARNSCVHAEGLHFSAFIETVT